MVTAESLCCGTPVVGFNSGAPELIALPEYSHFSEQGDIKQLMEGLNVFTHSKEAQNISEAAKKKYSSEKRQTINT